MSEVQPLKDHKCLVETEDGDVYQAWYDPTFLNDFRRNGLCLPARATRWCYLTDVFK